MAIHNSLCSPALLFLVVFVVQITLAVEEIRKAAEDAKCKGADINISSDQMMVILECAQELNVMSKADLSPEKMACFSKCMLGKQGLIDSEGKPHKEKIGDLIDSGLPEAIATEAKVQLGKCLDEHGPKIDMKEVTCKSFEPLTTCTHQAFLHLCTDH